MSANVTRTTVIQEKTAHSNTTHIMEKQTAESVHAVLTLLAVLSVCAMRGIKGMAGDVKVSYHHRQHNK